MAKLILRNKPRGIINLNGSLYMLIDSGMAKILEIEPGTELTTSVHYSYKHKGFYLAAYKSRKCSSKT
jgi:hypothetical protein